MKQILFFALLLACTSAFGVDYWACASADAGAANEWDTVSAACSGTKLTWASRVSGAVLHANNFNVALTSATSGDPGANGAVTLSNDNSAGATAGGKFTCDTTAGPATLTLAAVTAGSTTTSTLQISGSKSGTANCAIAGSAILTGGSATTSAAVTATHTVGALSFTIAYAIGGSVASTANGLNYTSASGSLTVTGNCKGGLVAAGCNLAGTGGNLTLNGNCIGSDTATGASGCVSSNASTASTFSVAGSIVSGKFCPGIQAGKFYLAPATTASAIYMPINSTYVSTDIVDSNGATLGSPTLTNAFVAPVAFVSSGIGTAANVKSGIVYGPYTGTLVTTGMNSGSAN